MAEEKEEITDFTTSLLFNSLFIADTQPSSDYRKKTQALIRMSFAFLVEVTASCSSNGFLFAQLQDFVLLSHHDKKHNPDEKEAIVIRSRTTWFRDLLWFNTSLFDRAINIASSFVRAFGRSLLGR